MVGMIQIVTYLLCVYLVFKGIEILQIGLTNTTASRGFTALVGVVALLASLVAAYQFSVWTTQQAEHVANSTSRFDQ